MSHFSQILAEQMRRDSARAFITFYDQASDNQTRNDGAGDERVELSLATYANWVAKAASLLAEEGDLQRGMRVRLDLPPHWMGAVFTGAAWAIGAVVTESSTPDLVVCGPETVATWAPQAETIPVFACSLSPLATRFTTPLPQGVRDVGVEVWGQPDAFTPWDPPEDADQADDSRTQGEIMGAAAAGSLLTSGGRLLSVANPASPPGFATLTEPLTQSGSLVLVRHLALDRLDSLVQAERVTHLHLSD